MNEGNNAKNIVNDAIHNRLSRLDFLNLSAAAALGAVAVPGITGCGPVTTKADCLGTNDQAAAAGVKMTFEASRIGSIRLKNRIIRSAVTMNGYDSLGRPTGGLLRHYEDIASGGAAAIITGMRDTGMVIEDFRYRDDYYRDYKKVPDVIHRYNIPVIQQISHYGGRGSLMEKKYFSVTDMKESDIEAIIAGFVRAIGITKRLGFDGVQLHAAHGYALSQFLSPAVNRRSDRWGGSTEKRFRVVREILLRSREAVKDFPLMIKINAFDNQRNGMRTEEAATIASLLEQAGFDAIEVSCGVVDDGFNTIRVPSIPNEALLRFTEYRRLPPFIKSLIPFITPVIVKRYEPLYNYNVCAAGEISKKVKIPVIVVGGIRKIDDIGAILATGAAGYVSLGRPFIIEPDIVNRFRKEAHAKSACINCGYCFMAAKGYPTPVRCFYGSL
jgi:2,4-dienoyl-CoA reductase-like NADH-dependent reductase (Old Yellow Enzyme family)